MDSIDRASSIAVLMFFSATPVIDWSEPIECIQPEAATRKVGSAIAAVDGWPRYPRCTSRRRHTEKASPESMYLMTHLLPIADTVFNLLDRIECVTTQPLVIAKSAQCCKVVGVSKLPNYLNGKGSNACPIILEPVLLV